MAKYRKGRELNRWKSNRPGASIGKLRIVGGKYRGRQIAYSGDPVTRPMKDHTREALFNLIGGWVPNKACFDLFAGTGAIGIESISRGASQAFLIERHFPSLKIIQENVNSLDPKMNVNIEGADSFFWVRQFLNSPETWPTEPWVVFVCPPYALFQERLSELLNLINGLAQSAPLESLIVVESDEKFELSNLPNPDAWESRLYPPALISVYKKREPLPN